MATLREALNDYEGMSKDERRRYLTDLSRRDPDKFDTFRGALVRQSQARKVSAGVERQTSLEEQLGAPVDLANRQGVSTLQRMDLARSTDASDRLAKMLGKGMDAKLGTDASGEQRVYVRSDPSQPYRQADPEGLDVRDVPAMFGNASEIAGGVAGSLITRNPSTMARAGQTMLGTMAGRATDIGVEALRGYESREWQDLFTDLGISGASAGAAEGVAPVLTKLMNFVSARGSKDALDTGRREVISIIESDPDLKALGFGQNPEGLLSLLRGRFSQFDKSLRIQELEQSQGLAESLKRILTDIPEGQIDATVSTLDDVSLTQLQDNLRQKATNDVQRLLLTGDRKLSLDQAGKQVQWGIFDPKKEGSFREAASAIEDVRWAKVKNFAGDDFVFDLSPLLVRIDDLTRQFAAEGQAGPVLAERTIPRQIWSIINRVRSVENGVVPKTVRWIEEEGTGILGPDGKEILRQIPRESDGFEFLRTLRQDLGDYFGHDNVLSPRDEATARKLWGGFKEVLENPQGPSGDQFRQALIRANRATEFKHEVLETNSMLRMAKSDNPASILQQIESGALGFQQLQLLKRTMPEDRWNNVTTYLKQDLVEHPEKIDNVLNTGLGGDKKRLGLFLTPAEQTSLATYQRAMKEIDGNVFAKTMQRQTDESVRALEMFNKASPEELRQLVAFTDGQAKFELRSALLEGIMRNAAKDEFGQVTFNPATITKNMDKIFDDPVTEKKMLAFLEPETIRALRDRKFVASYLAGRGFSAGGAGIAAGATAAQVTDITNPLQVVSAVFTARSIGIMSQLLNSPLALRYLNNATEPFSESQILRTAAVAASVIGQRQAQQQASLEPRS